jgi:hypothetical protein
MNIGWSSRVALFLVLTTPLAHADVLVVDPGGGNGEMLLRGTIYSAADGDALLLKAGIYESPLGFSYEIAGNARVPCGSRTAT